MKQDATLVPTRWKANLQTMNKRDKLAVPVSFKQWTPRQIRRVYTKAYVDNLLERATQNDNRLQMERLVGGLGVSTESP